MDGSQERGPSSLEKGLASATDLLCDEARPLTGRGPAPMGSASKRIPDFMEESSGNQEWKKAVEIRRVSLCSVHRVTETRF